MHSPPSRLSELGWILQAPGRIRQWWPAKMLATTLGMTAFFVAYFWVLRHPFSAVTEMPLTAVDRLIGFQPGALPLYLSLWFYVSLAPALVVNPRELWSYGAAAIVLSVVGLGIFFLWPTAVPRPDIDWSEHPAFGFLKSMDASGNACPSLHVAFAVFSGVWFERLLRRLHAGPTARVVNWCWCVGILYSTVATRQHAFLDVVAGAALGVVVAVAHLAWLARSADPAKPYN